MKIARWLFETLHGKRLPDTGDAATEEEIAALDVYFDQTAPAVADWKAIHQPRLRTAQAMIVVCTPGSFQRLDEKNDWVHLEIEWWLRNRKVAPILIDATGEGARWVPKVIKDRWPDAQRITVVPDDLDRLQGDDLRSFEEQVRSRVLNGIVLSKHRVVFEDLERQKRMSKRLKIALAVAGVALLSTILAAVLAARAWDSAKENARTATENARIATVRYLAAESKVATRDRVKMALALEAYRRSTEQGLGISDGEQALRDAVGDAGVYRPTGNTYVAFSPDGYWLATGCVDGSASLSYLGYYYSRFKGYRGAFTDVLLWHSHKLGGHRGDVCVTVFTSDSRRLITGGQDGTAQIWDLKGDAPSRTSIVLRGHEKAIKVMATSPDGHWLATAGEDGTCRLWDLTAEDPSDSSPALRGHTAEVWSIGISPDGRWLATGSRDGTARLWDLAAEDPSVAPAVLGGHVGTVMDMAFSPDSRLLATGGFTDGSPRLWDLTASDPSACATVLTGGTEDLRALAISPDGRWLATGYHDSTVRLWTLADKGRTQAPVVLRGHTRPIWDVVFTPDRRWLATAGDDTVVRLWDLTAPDPRAIVVVLQSSANSSKILAISPDSHWLAGSGWGSTVLWTLRAEDLVPLARRNGQGGSLTKLEWLRYFPDEEYRDTGAGFGLGQTTQGSGR